MFGKKLLYPLLIFIFIATDLFANDFLFSTASAPLVYISFLIWFIIGLVLKIMKVDIVFIKWGAVLVIVLSFGACFHVELAIIVWLIYLSILVVYFAFPRKEVTSKQCKVNLIYHGTFFIIILIGGVISKYLYWSKMGGYARWAAAMRDIYPGFLYFCGIIFLLQFGYISYTLFKKNSERK